MNRPRESPAGRKRRLFSATVLNLPLPSTFLATKIKSPTYPTHQPGRRYKMHYTHNNGKRSQSSLGTCFGYVVCSISPALGVWELDIQRKGLCRRCGKESETIQHITAACEQLAATDYVKRHDGLAKVVH